MFIFNSTPSNAFERCYKYIDCLTDIHKHQLPIGLWWM